MYEPGKHEQYPFVMGIEFGASSSGISVAHTRFSGNVYTIENSGPFANNEHCNQTLTSILYKYGDINDLDNIVCGIHDIEINTSNGGIYIKNIKEIAFNYQNEIEYADIESLGLTPTKLVSDYLRCVHQMAVMKLEERDIEERKKLYENFTVKDSDVEDFKVELTRYCIACPRDQNKFMGKCFIEAGIIKDEEELAYRLDYLTESEATAYSVLAWNRKSSKIKPSENYLICNLGHTSLGISEIIANTTESFSKVNLIDEYPGEGSMLLEDAFSRLIKRKNETLSLDQDIINDLIQRFVSNTKFGFDDSFIEDTVNELSVSEVNNTKALEDLIVSTGDLSRDVFQPVIQKFIRKIFTSMEKGENKNNATYKKIYVTGRYGYESYFLDKLSNIENEKYRKDIILVSERTIDQKIDHTIDFVSRGAVYFAMRKKPTQIPFFHAKDEPLRRTEIPKEVEKKIKECDFICGIDFGTTYSGISYSVPQTGETIQSIDKWQTTSTFQKCPSIVVYDKNYEKVVRWGNKANSKAPKKDEHKLELFKLSLSPSKVLDHYKVENEKQDISKKNRGSSDTTNETEIVIKKLQEDYDLRPISVEKVIIDYIKCITDHAKKELFESKEGSTWWDKYLFGKSKENLNIFYVLTVPAMWDAEAQNIMKEAALGSKIIKDTDNLLMITEPEAAALSYQDLLKEFHNNEKKTYLVCDAGGGTVDLVTFRLEENDKKELVIKQLCPGDGDLCGSTQVDKQYKIFIRDFYREVLQGQINALKDIDDTLKHFREKIKPTFDYDETREGFERIKLPDEPNLSNLEHPDFVPGTGNQKIDVRRKDIAEKVFDPVIDRVIELLNKQIKRLGNIQPDVILLVGGFSGSKYLQKRLIRKYGGIIKIHKKPLTAISQGAVSYALKPRMIAEKVIGQSYAIEVKTEFEHGVDNLENRVGETDMNGNTVFYSTSRLEYFVRGGERAEKNTQIIYKKEVYVEYPKNATIAIFTSVYDEKIELPRYVDPVIHTKIMEINIDMPNIHGAELKENIPFEIFLMIDEINGTTVVVKCKKGDMPVYKAHPKIPGKPLLYICDKSVTVKDKNKTKEKYTHPSADRN